MKKLHYFVFTLCIVLSFSSCIEDSCQTERTYVEYKAIYKTLDELRASTITVSQKQEIENAGKIYLRGDKLLVSDVGKGVHIIDNSDKTNPILEAFIEIEGNIDISMKGDFMFADGYLDVLVIDVKEPTSPALVGRMRDVKDNQFYLDPVEDKYVVGYEMTSEVRTLDCNHPEFSNTQFEEDGSIFVDDTRNDSGGPVGPQGPAGPAGASGGDTAADAGGGGIAGSLARFAILGDYFYYIDNSNMNIFNIEDVEQPFFINSFQVDWGIETLFPYEDKLFIGGRNGMFIYDNSNPANPVFMSEFNHAQSCDPVYVQGNTAYVTLRQANTCWNGNNQLDVIDISDLFNPRLIQSYPMHNPHGLSVVDDILYICDEKAGLKIFDKSDPLSIDRNMLSQFGGITAHDIIARSHDCLIVTGPSGIIQIDASNSEEPVLLSEIVID